MQLQPVDGWDQLGRRPGSWWRNPRTGQVDVSCGNGHIAGIPYHSVSTDGSVSPSLDCGQCGWHVNAQLVGWDAGEKPAVREY